jgi:hypothetical protein
MFALFAAGGGARSSPIFSRFSSVSSLLSHTHAAFDSLPFKRSKAPLLLCHFVYYHQSGLMLTVLCEFIPIIHFLAFP